MLGQGSFNEAVVKLRQTVLAVQELERAVDDICYIIGGQVACRGYGV